MVYCRFKMYIFCPKTRIFYIFIITVLLIVTFRQKCLSLFLEMSISLERCQVTFCVNFEMTFNKAINPSLPLGFIKVLFRQTFEFNFLYFSRFFGSCFELISNLGRFLSSELLFLSFSKLLDILRF